MASNLQLFVLLGMCDSGSSIIGSKTVVLMQLFYGGFFVNGELGKGMSIMMALYAEYGDIPDLKLSRRSSAYALVNHVEITYLCCVL